MEKHSHRQYLTWLAWLDKQWNVLDKKDYELLRIAQRVQQVLSKNRGQITLDDQKVEFKRKKPVRQLSKKEKTQRAKAGWFGWLGVKPKDKKRGG